MDLVSGNALIISLALGFIMPFIVSFIKKEHWSLKVKNGISIATAFVAAAAVTYFTGGAHVSSWAEFTTTFGVIFAAANVLYTQWFKDTAFEQFFAKRSGFGDQTPDPVVDTNSVVDTPTVTDGGNGGGGV